MTTPTTPRRARPLAWVLLVAAVLFVASCGGAQGEQRHAAIPGGDAEAGREKIVQFGCVSCHAVPGVPSVTRGVGPDLEGFEDQLYISGQIPNRPEELIRWLLDPQALIPGTAMPSSGLSEQDARDIAAYVLGQ